MSVVKPIGFRMGWARGWQCTGYVNRSNYSWLYHEKLLIRISLTSPFSAGNAYVHLILTQQIRNIQYLLITIYWKRQYPFLITLLWARLALNVQKFRAKCWLITVFWEWRDVLGKLTSIWNYFQKWYLILKTWTNRNRSLLKRHYKENIPIFSIWRSSDRIRVLQIRALRQFLVQFLYPGWQLISLIANLNWIQRWLFSEKTFWSYLRGALRASWRFFFFNDLLTLTICCLWIHNFQMVLDFMAYQFHKVPRQQQIIWVFGSIIKALWASWYLAVPETWRFSRLTSGWFGLELCVNGKFNRGTWARTVWLHVGSIPTSTVHANIEYVVNTATPKQGVMGLRIYTYFGLTDTERLSPIKMRGSLW